MLEDKKRIIVGLGNPGSEYKNTRHNIGFDAVELFARLNSLTWGRLSAGSITSSGRIKNADVVAVKPMTYMNLSGEPLSRIVRNSPVDPGEIIVVVDDIHLPVGRIRIRQGGSDGGHNGLKSITAHLKTQDYPRLRIGVGEPGDDNQQIDYVLGKFNKTEQEVMDEVLGRVVAALETWLEFDTETAMNRFNGG